MSLKYRTFFEVTQEVDIKPNKTMENNNKSLDFFIIYAYLDVQKYK